MILPDLLDQLILRQRGLESLHLVALLLQNITSSLVYILEEKDLDILGVEGLQLLGGLRCRSSTEARGW